MRERFQMSSQQNKAESDETDEEKEEEENMPNYDSHGQRVGILTPWGKII